MNITKVATTGEIRGWTTKTADNVESGTNYVVYVKLFDEMTNGTGSDQANKIYADTNTILAGARNTIDLAGSVSDVYGDTITFTKIKGIILKNTSTTAAVLALGGGSDGAGTNAFDTWIRSAAGGGAGDGSEQVLVRAGGFVMFYTPDSTAYAVTAGTGDILGIVETATLAGSYEIAILGVA